MAQLRLIACGSAGAAKTTLIEQLSNRFTIASMPADAADIPGRVTEIASADVAIILLDASQGLSPQTRRDWFITSLFGVRHAVIAVNEMDQTDFDEAIFQSIVEPCQAFADKLDFESVAAIPLSASPPWYQGPTLLEYLQTISADCWGEWTKATRWLWVLVTRDRMRALAACSQTASITRLRPN